MRIKRTSSEYWTAVQVRNHRVGVKSVEFKRGEQWVAMTRADDNYFAAEKGVGKGAMVLRMTAVDGQAVEQTLAETAEAAGPGFVNLHVSDAWLTEALADLLAAGDSYGGGSAVSPGRVQVEMVTANPTGPVTVAPPRHGARARVRPSGSVPYSPWRARPPGAALQGLGRAPGRC